MTKYTVDMSAIKLETSCIQLLRPVLDDAYERIPLKEAEKDKVIKRRLEQLGSSYIDLTQGDDIDYSDSVTRFAYIYRYVACHANIVSELIGATPELASLFDQERVTVSCIGGGPGSEMVGIAKYLRDSGKKPRVKCTIYDRDQSWGDSWHDIQEKIHFGFEMHPMFKYLDATDKKTWGKEEKYLESDLFTLVFFMSEVYKHRDLAEPYFTNLFGRAKKGALFLFVDNSAGGFKEWFDELAKKGRLKILAAESNLFTMSYAEEKRDFGPYYEKFLDPRITARIAWRVAEKK